MARAREGQDGAERMIQQLSQIVLARIAADKLVLPCLPSAGAQCTRILRDAEPAPRQLTEAIERDPLLTVQLVRLASSGEVANESLEQSVARLGPKRLRAPLAEAAARPMAKSPDQGIANACRAIFEHALGVALLARDLAALAQCESPDAAFTAGLLHDVGKPVVAGMLLEAERQLSNGSSTRWLSLPAWQRAVEELHRPIGIALAERWGLPAVVLRCIKDTNEFDSTDRGSPVNFVVLANALAKRAGLADLKFDADDVGALEVIGRSMLGVSEELVGRLTAGIVERVRGQQLT